MYVPMYEKIFCHLFDLIQSASPAVSSDCKSPTRGFEQSKTGIDSWSIRKGSVFGIGMLKYEFGWLSKGELQFLIDHQHLPISTFARL